MTTDTVVLERALTVMAICMALQTVLFVSGAIAAYVAWRRASAALMAAKAEVDAQVVELRGYLDRLSSRVDEAADAFVRSTSTVDDVVSDVRSAMSTVSGSVGSVASVVTAPRAALAMGLLRGFQMWRKRRAAQRVAAAVTSEL
jgi:hypothetical protein